jgi:hypothetical protein
MAPGTSRAPWQMVARSPWSSRQMVARPPWLGIPVLRSGLLHLDPIIPPLADLSQKIAPGRYAFRKRDDRGLCFAGQQCHRHLLP